MVQSQQQTDEKFLLFKAQINQNFDENPKKSYLLKHVHCFWSDRFIFGRSSANKKFLNFNAFDLLMNETRVIRLRKSSLSIPYITLVYSLDGEFGIFTASCDGIYHVYLAKINWNTDEFELIEKFDIEGQDLYVLIDKMNTSKFVFQYVKNDNTFVHQTCTLIDEKIDRKEIQQVMGWYTFYSKNRLIGFDTRPHVDEIITYNLNSKKVETFEIDRSLLENVESHHCWEWVNESLYTCVKFKDTKKYGIAYADLVTKKWNLMDFEPGMKIGTVEFFNGNLIVSTYRSKTENGVNFFSGFKYYSIPMRRPQSLRQKAWLLVVQIMKKREEKDPYKSAKEFLPLNSDLREPWFKDEEKKGN